ncbi:MAG: hypothetical protein LBJ96_03200 [Holosporaceae bacterium]|nr:hypothetical protein [Holosporaceae bacterium]
MVFCECFGTQIAKNTQTGRHFHWQGISDTEHLHKYFEYMVKAIEGTIALKREWANLYRHRIRKHCMYIFDSNSSEAMTVLHSDSEMSVEKPEKAADSEEAELRTVIKTASPSEKKIYPDEIDRSKNSLFKVSDSFDRLKDPIGDFNVDHFMDELKQSLEALHKCQTDEDQNKEETAIKGIYKAAINGFNLKEPDSEKENLNRILSNNIMTSKGVQHRIEELIAQKMSESDNTMTLNIAGAQKSIKYKDLAELVVKLVRSAICHQRMLAHIETLKETCTNANLENLKKQGPDNIKTTIVKCLENEANADLKDHYVFYHGVEPRFGFNYELMSALRQVLSETNKSPGTGKEDLKIIFRSGEEAFKSMDNLEKFFNVNAKKREEEEKEDWVKLWSGLEHPYNYLGDFNKIGICANIFLSGNPNDLASNGLVFLNTGSDKQYTSNDLYLSYRNLSLTARKKADQKDIEEMIKEYGDELVALAEKFKELCNHKGALYQIFIHKDVVNKVTYICEDYGERIKVGEFSETSEILDYIKGENKGGVVDLSQLNRSAAQFRIRRMKCALGGHGAYRDADKFLFFSTRKFDQKDRGLYNFLESRILAFPEIFLSDKVKVKVFYGEHDDSSSEVAKIRQEIKSFAKKFCKIGGESADNFSQKYLNNLKSLEKLEKPEKTE